MFIDFSLEFPQGKKILKESYDEGTSLVINIMNLLMLDTRSGTAHSTIGGRLKRFEFSKITPTMLDSIGETIDEAIRIHFKDYVVSTLTKAEATRIKDTQRNVIKLTISLSFNNHKGEIEDIESIYIIEKNKKNKLGINIYI